MKIFLSFIVGIFFASSVFSSDLDPLQKALRRDFSTFFKTGYVGRILRNVARELNLENILFESSPAEDWDEPKISLFCSTCAAGVNEILRLNNTDLIITGAIDLCLELGLGTPTVCEGLINLNADDVIYIFANTPEETGNDVCGVIFVGRGCTSRNPDRVWEVALPDVPKPPVDDTPYPEDPTDTLKILHISDTHYDPEYAPGSPTVCEEMYLCCRDKGIPPSGANETAGFWGSYGPCDVPKWTLAAMYEHISTTHPDIDFIIWTGDVIPHDVWETTKSNNIAIINEMADLISQYFPNTPVFPAVGNHEGNPVNQFPQPYINEPEFDISWLYDELATIWGRWLSEEAATSIAYSGYYSVQIQSGLKIISVNTNHCNALNWWLIIDSTDIANELDLMAKELQKSEDIGEMVYIIGHIGSGNGDCSLTWSNQFNKIILRYESTISGIFYGHNHGDKFQLFFDPNDMSRAYEIGYIGQSQTTYSDLNPGYKIYTAEGDFNGSRYRILDHENWILDLSIANALNESNFVKLYSAKEEYGLPDLSAASWFDLVLEMAEPNSTLFDAFYRNSVKASTPKMISGCDEECKNGTLCGLLISDNSDRSKCDGLQQDLFYY